MIDRLALLALSNAERCPVRVDHIPRQPRPVNALTGETTPKKPASKRRPANTGESVPHLILTCRGKTLKRVPANRSRFVIGRNEQSDLRIVHDFISRRHAIFFRQGGNTILVDLKSRNGTFVNGKRISHRVLINNDIISLGDHRIKFIDPAARRRTTLRGAGWDETTISKSIKALRNTVGKNWGARSAG
jgi:pSer/pThr/pTyr-binding forkhead associated (FHA) protein